MANNGRTKLFGDGADNVNLFLPQGAFGSEGFFDNANAGGGNDTVQGNLADNVINGQGGNERSSAVLATTSLTAAPAPIRLMGRKATTPSTATAATTRSLVD